MPLTTQTTHAFKWSLLGELASRLIAPAVFLLLARLLTPEDFGVVAAATVVISFCQAIAEAGLGKALVQRRDRIEESADVAFWINLAIALAVLLALTIAAPWIAIFFRDERVANITRVLAFQLPLAALCTIPTALLQRDLAFRELFWARLLTAGLPALLSTPMALSGMGYWALVAGAIVGQALQAFALWRLSGWRPKARFDASLARELMHFGKWVLLSAVLTWFYTWMDSLLVGRNLGAHDMGLYRIGTTFISMVFGLAFAPLLPVLYSLLSRSSHQANLVADSLIATARAIVLVSLPIGALLALLSPSVESRIFGAEWAGLAPVLTWLAAGQGLAWLVGANGEAYRAMGRPDLEFRAMGISAAIYFAGYLVAIQHGLMAFVITRAILVLIGVAVQVWIAGRLFGLGKKPWLLALAKPALFTIVAAAAAYAASTFATGIAADAVLVVVFLLTYIAQWLALDRSYLVSIRQQLRQI